MAFNPNTSGRPANDSPIPHETYPSPQPFDTRSPGYPVPTPPPFPARRIEIPSSVPVVTYILLALNIAVFLLDQFVLNRYLTLLGAKENLSIASGEYWRLFTPMFLHVNFIHILMNGYFLWMVGPQLERPFGYLRFLAIYFFSGITGNIASFIFNPQAFSIGASGALFGLIGALLPFLYFNRKVLRDTRSSILNIIQVILINLAIGFAIHVVDNAGHIGGLLGGLIMSALITPRYLVERDVEGIPTRVKDTTPLIVTPLAIMLLSSIAGGIFIYELLRMQ